MRLMGKNPLDQSFPTSGGHPKVGRDDIKPFLHQSLGCKLAARRLGNGIALRLKETSAELPQHGIVVHNQDAAFLHDRRG